MKNKKTSILVAALSISFILTSQNTYAAEETSSKNIVETDESQLDETINEEVELEDKKEDTSKEAEDTGEKPKQEDELPNKYTEEKSEGTKEIKTEDIIVNKGDEGVDPTRAIKNLPAGARASFDGHIDTSTPGKKTVEVQISYDDPEKSPQIVMVNVIVKDIEENKEERSLSDKNPSKEAEKSEVRSRSNEADPDLEFGQTKIRAEFDKVGIDGKEMPFDKMFKKGSTKLTLVDFEDDSELSLNIDKDTSEVTFEKPVDMQRVKDGDFLVEFQGEKLRGKFVEVESGADYGEAGKTNITTYKLVLYQVRNNDIVVKTKDESDKPVANPDSEKTKGQIEMTTKTGNNGGTVPIPKTSKETMVGKRPNSLNKDDYNSGLNFDILGKEGDFLVDKDLNKVYKTDEIKVDPEGLDPTKIGFIEKPLVDKEKDRTEDDDYVRVDFASGAHGTLKESPIYHVAKGASRNTGKSDLLKAPEILPDKGWQSTGWDKNIKEKYTEDTTHQATYEQIPGEAKSGLKTFVGEEIGAENAIANVGVFPAGAVYEWAVRPNFDEVGNQSGSVEITYDGVSQTVEGVSVLVKEKISIPAKKLNEIPGINKLTNKIFIEKNPIEDITISPENPNAYIKVEGLPGGLSYENGKITGTPQIEDWKDEEEKTFSPKVTVTNSDGSKKTEEFEITVQRDTDGDGTPDVTDKDDDGDGVFDEEEKQKGSDPKNKNDIPASKINPVGQTEIKNKDQTVTENKPIKDINIETNDKDATTRVENLPDGLKYDPKTGKISGKPKIDEWGKDEEERDLEIEVTTENSDGSKTNDKVKIKVQRDTDGDGTPDVTDKDDDGDGVFDEEEKQKGSDPKDKDSTPSSKKQADTITPILPSEKTQVEDKNKLTDEEKSKVKKKLEDANKFPDEGQKSTDINIDDKGNATITYPDGSKDLIPGEDLVIERNKTRLVGKVNPVKASDDKQKTGLRIENIDNKTPSKLRAKDKNGNNIPVEIDKEGNILVTPGSKVSGPITLIVEDEDLEEGRVKVNIPVKDTDSSDDKGGGFNPLPDNNSKGQDDMAKEKDEPKKEFDKSKEGPKEDKSNKDSNEGKSEKDKNKNKQATNKLIIPSHKTGVKDLEKLDEGEKEIVRRKIKEVNPKASDIIIDDRGNARLIYPDRSENLIPAKDLIYKSKTEAAREKSLNDKKVPGQAKVDESNKSASTNVKTGIGSLASVLKAAGLALGGLFISKRKED